MRRPLGTEKSDWVMLACVCVAAAKHWHGFLYFLAAFWLLRAFGEWTTEWFAEQKRGRELADAVLERLARRRGDGSPPSPP